MPGRTPVFGQVPGQEWFDVARRLAAGWGGAVQVRVRAAAPRIDLPQLERGQNGKGAAGHMSADGHEGKLRVWRRIVAAFAKTRVEARRGDDLQLVGSANPRAGEHGYRGQRTATAVGSAESAVLFLPLAIRHQQHLAAAVQIIVSGQNQTRSKAVRQTPGSMRWPVRKDSSAAGCGRKPCTSSTEPRCTTSRRQ